jgi:transposase
MEYLAKLDQIHILSTSIQWVHEKGKYRKKQLQQMLSTDAVKNDQLIECKN